ncbi:MAG: hypothetical protein V1674_02845 [Candidatus Omnitrophota bacterium]
MTRRIRLGIAVYFLFSIFYFLCFSISAFAQAESVTLTTYYPSPYGEYNRLKANRLGVGSTAAVPANDGDISATGSAAVTGDITSGAKVTGSQLCIGASCLSAWPTSFIPDPNAAEFFNFNCADLGCPPQAVGMNMPLIDTREFNNSVCWRYSAIANCPAPCGAITANCYRSMYPNAFVGCGP